MRRSGRSVVCTRFVLSTFVIGMPARFTCFLSFVPAAPAKTHIVARSCNMGEIEKKRILLNMGVSMYSTPLTYNKSNHPQSNTTPLFNTLISKTKEHTTETRPE